MAFQGEYFLNRYGKEKTLYSPPIKKIIDADIPVGMGTDATRVSSYNPWLCLYWLTTGKTVGGTSLYQEDNILSRDKALELYTKGSAWFSNEATTKGSFLPNQLADFAVLSHDFFSVSDEEIKNIYSLMTVVGGKVVHACEQFSQYNPPLPPVSPDWSPVMHYGTYGANKLLANTVMRYQHSCKALSHHEQHRVHDSWGSGCFCWAF